MKKRLRKTVLVTGGSRGIGEACADLFFKSGANVVIISRTARELNKTAQRISASGADGRMLALSGDVSDESFVQKIFAAARLRFGRIDVLINNAAILIAKRFPMLSVGDWDETMAVNLRGPFLCAREFFLQFDKTGSRSQGIVINITSLGGIQDTPKFPGMSAYVVSKFGITGLTEALAVEGREYGIDCIGVAPGAVDTSMLRKAAPHLKPGAGPGNIARVVLELAESGSSSLLNGTTIRLDTNL